MDSKPPRPPLGRYRWIGAVAAAVLVAVGAAVEWSTLFSAGGKAGPVMKATVPPHLGLVPPEATFFMTIRVADLWLSGDGKILRANLPEIDRDLSEELEGRIGIPVQEMETFTFVIPSFDGTFDRNRYEKKYDEPRPKEEKFEKPKIEEKKFEKKPGKKFDEKFDSSLGIQEPLPQFVSAPVSRVQPQEDQRPDEPIFIVTATNAAAVAKLRAQVVKEAVEQKHKGKTYYISGS